MDNEDVYIIVGSFLMLFVALFAVGFLSYKEGRIMERTSLTKELERQTEAIMNDGYKLCVDDMQKTQSFQNKFWYNKGVKDTLAEQDDGR